MPVSNKLQSIPEMERPYEKCLRIGASNLTNEELLAILLRTGTRGENVVELSARLIKEAGASGLLGLHRFSIHRLKQVKGIGEVKAIQISAILELAKRLSKATYEESLCFSHPETIAHYYMEDLRHEQQENIKLLMLNSKSKLLGESNISKGTVNGAFITPREMFIEALEKNAVNIILLHNHPSGDPNPSEQDKLLTKRVYDAGRLIGIELIDHIIIGNNCYYSFCENHMLEKGI